jgi:hypothetical protein
MDSRRSAANKKSAQSQCGGVPVSDRWEPRSGFGICGLYPTEGIECCFWDLGLVDVLRAATSERLRMGPIDSWWLFQARADLSEALLCVYGREWALRSPKIEGGKWYSPMLVQCSWNGPLRLWEIWCGSSSCAVVFETSKAWLTVLWLFHRGGADKVGQLLHHSMYKWFIETAHYMQRQRRHSIVCRTAGRERLLQNLRKHFERERIVQSTFSLEQGRETKRCSRCRSDGQRLITKRTCFWSLSPPECTENEEMSNEHCADISLFALFEARFSVDF